MAAMSDISSSVAEDTPTNCSYDIVYAAEFNGDASFLAAGDSSGKLAIFDIHKSAAVTSALSLPTNSNSNSKPHPASACLNFETDGGAIYAMHSDKDLLACGVDKGMLFANWGNILDGKSQFQSMQVNSPHSNNVPFEVNGIASMSGGDRLFLAAGDGNAYSVDLATLEQTQTFVGAGPGAYLHCTCMFGTGQQNTFLTGADDGCVRLYDCRAGPMPQRVLNPSKNANSVSSSWVGSLIADDDGVFAMVGNGARELCTLHIASGTIAHSVKLDVIPVSLKIMGDSVYCGGIEKRIRDASSLQVFNMQCQTVSGVHSSKPGIYSIAMHANTQVAATAGYSLTACGTCAAPDVIDVYLSPPLRSFSMIMA